MDQIEKDLRFQLVYRYPDGENTKLWRIIILTLRDQDERDPYCLTNMAMVLEELDMATASVNILKQAKEFDQPYPHGNLAIALATAGFSARAMIEELPEHRRLQTRAAEAVVLLEGSRARKQGRWSSWSTVAKYCTIST